MDKTKILSRAELSRVSAKLVLSANTGKLRWRAVQPTSAGIICNLVHVTMSVEMWNEVMEPSDSERFLSNAVSKLQGLRISPKTEDSAEIMSQWAKRQLKGGR